MSTPASAIAAVDVRDYAGVTSRRRAEGLIDHQREDHCRQHLVAVRCSAPPGGWDCTWTTDAGRGQTQLARHYPAGIPVTC